MVLLLLALCAQMAGFQLAMRHHAWQLVLGPWAAELCSTAATVSEPAPAEGRHDPLGAIDGCCSSLCAAATPVLPATVAWHAAGSCSQAISAWVKTPGVAIALSAPLARGPPRSA